MLTEADLARAARESGFRADVLERVIRMMDLLEQLLRHSFLESRIALKGGTALNLFVLDLPRLSVDVDLNYIGSPDRETMLADRPTLEKAIAAICGRLDIDVRRVPGKHAGGKWRLTYSALAGGKRSLELDINYVLRTPLWPPRRLSSHAVGPFRAADVTVLDPHELAAGKLVALLAREASRDLFDARALLSRGGLDPARLRTAFVVYGGANRVDWRNVGLDSVNADPIEVDRKLVPVLRENEAPQPAHLEPWTRALVEQCRELLGVVLPLGVPELEFLERLNGAGEIAPELLTDDADLQSAIREHPGLRWKALNVRKRLGRD